MFCIFKIYPIGNLVVCIYHKRFDEKKNTFKNLNFNVSSQGKEYTLEF